MNRDTLIFRMRVILWEVRNLLGADGSKGQILIRSILKYILELVSNKFGVLSSLVHV